MISRAFSTMPGLASGIARDIRNGTVKKYLIQPIDMLGFLLLYRMAHKLVYYLIAVVPFALVFWVCRGYFSGWPDAATIAAFVASLVMSFLLGLLPGGHDRDDRLLVPRGQSLLFVYMLFSFFFSGHMFPLDMLPGFAGELMRVLPFQYLAYFPAAVFLGKITGPELAVGLALHSAGWWSSSSPPG